MNYITKINVNGTEYAVGSDATEMASALTTAGYKLTDNDTITKINGKTGDIPASDIASVLTSAGYALTDNNTVTYINGKTGNIAAADIASVLTAAGYKLTDTNTWPTLTSQLSNDSGFLTGITKAMVTDALGYTPATTDTNTWRPITNTYTGSSQDTSVSQYGTNALYNALVNGYANNAGTASTAGQVNISLGGASVADAIYATIADNDFFRLRVGGTGSNAGYVELATADDATEPIYLRQYTGVFENLIRTATLLDASGNTSFPGTVSAASFSGKATSAGYADSAGSVAWGNVSGRPTSLSSFTNDSGYITGITGTMVVNALGYTPPTSDTNTVTSINGKTGAIAAADIASVLTSAGYKLTDADTNTWRPITNTYTGSDQSTSVSQYGTNALYNALVNGYANSAGNADTVDGYHASSFVLTSDSRLSDARPASDVYSWAKSSSKPSYTPSEVGIYVRYVTTATDDVYLTPSTSITGSANSGKMETVIVQSTSDDLYVYVTNGDIKCPGDQDIELEIYSGGNYYVEVNFLNINGTIYARGAGMG